MQVDEDDEYEWVDVTDPALVKELMGVKGVQQMGKTAGQAGDPLVTAPSGLKAAELKAWQKGRASVEALGLLEKLRKNYDTNFNESGISAIKEYLPSQKNSALDKQISGLLGPAKAAYRVDGEGAFSDTDMQLLRDALPSRYGFDGGNQQSMRDLDAQLRGHIRTGFGAAGLSAEDVLRAADSNTYKGPNTDGPLDKQAMFDKMVAEGRTTQELMDFLKDTGADPAAVDAQKDAIAADRNYRFANPGKSTGPAITIPNAPPSATNKRPDAAAIKAKYGIQ